MLKWQRNRVRDNPGASASYIGDKDLKLHSFKVVDGVKN